LTGPQLAHEMVAAQAALPADALPCLAPDSGLAYGGLDRRSTSNLGAATVGVDLWRAQLDLDQLQLSAFSSTLSADEIDRSRRFHRNVDRQRFVARRGWLRRILGDYLGVHPEVLRFARDANGKPRLAGAASQRLRFNMSHSGGLALYAVCTDREVGVDIERVSEDVDIDALAQRVFSKTEQETLAALPADRRVRAFFECWTRKEAHLKAIGVGLSGLEPYDDDDAANWSLHSVDAGSGYAAALAVAGVADVPATAKLLLLNERSERNGAQSVLPRV
jgi:4'-phosphopantetheinyl transferase